MDEIIDNLISDSEIAVFARSYERCRAGVHDDGEQIPEQEKIMATFQYAIALLRSTHKQDIQRGIALLENMYYEGNGTARRDYLYYVAIGHIRLKQYNLALDCVEHFLQFEPENQQAKKLRVFIKEKMIKEGIMGMAITGGAVLALGGLIGLGLSLAKK